MKAAGDMMEQALRWVSVLEDGDAGEAERRDFDRWLAADPRHAQAWRRARQVWDHAGRAEPVFRAARTVAVPPPVRSRRVFGRLALAAAVALLALTGVLAGRPGLFADQRTAAGERRAVVLADGSHVEMGSATALSAVMGGEIRRVTLHAGEAFFTVAADAARPFEVEAGGGRIRALGTAFDVKLAGGGVVVAVAEHAVAVSGPTSAAAVRVEEGRQVRYGPHGIGSPAAADPRQVQAWRRDRLIFQEAPLREVVRELARHRPEPVMVTDDAVAAMAVTAVFDTRRTDEALDTIAATLPVRVTRLGGLLTLVRPAE